MKNLSYIYIFTPGNSISSIDAYFSNNIKLTLTPTEEVTALVNQLIAIINEQKTPEEVQSDLYFKTLAIKVPEMFTTEEILEKISAFDKWKAGVVHKFGEYYQYENNLYKVISKNLDADEVDQGFTSQEDWTPDVAVSLYVKVAPPGVIAEWVQPTGAHDAYNIGDKVLFNTLVWQSKINANTWSPTVYPAGWEQLP